jgi:hypothetical protein
MTKLRRWQARLALAACAATFAGRADAHIDLRTPVPREQGLSEAPNSNLKVGPCGQVNNGRTDRVNEYAPHDTIEVTWAETTNHRSYYRVAFDRDGDDDLPLFAGPGVREGVIDPRERCPVDGQVILAYEMQDGYGEQHTLRVQLPDVECERCTLQVIQYMFGSRQPYYFQCADLVLRRPAPGEDGAHDAGSGPEDAAVSTAQPRAASGCFSRLAPADAGLGGRTDEDEPAPALEPAAAPGENDGAEPAAPPSTPPAAASATRTDSGCALGPWHGRDSPTALGLFCVASLGWRRARRKRQLSAPMTRLVNVRR